MSSGCKPFLDPGCNSVQAAVLGMYTAGWVVVGMGVMQQEPESDFVPAGPTDPEVHLLFPAWAKAGLMSCPSPLTRVGKSQLQGRSQALAGPDGLGKSPGKRPVSSVEVISRLCPQWRTSAPSGNEYDTLPCAPERLFPGELLWGENCGKTCGGFLWTRF